jgi:hypothetical protein
MSVAITVVESVDHGPMARLEVVVAQASTPSVVFQRLTDAEKPETLREIAKAWQVPAGRFIEWFTTTHVALYDAALKVRADQLAHEALAIADEQHAVEKKDGTTYDPEVPRDKLRTDTRLKLASRWDRSRYGDQAVSTTINVNAPGSLVNILSGMDAAVVAQPGEDARVIEHAGEDLI